LVLGTQQYRAKETGREGVKRNVYLSMKTLEEARAAFFSRFGLDFRGGVEEVRVEESLGRVTAEPIFAKMSTPTYHSAAMDGIAVRAEETYGTTELQRP
jgi:putative molybdopterin biosynthesis protein